MTENRKNQIELFRPREISLWKKVAKFHNIIVKNNAPQLPKEYNKKQFTEDFNIEVDFPLPDTAVQQKQEGEKDMEETEVKVVEEPKEDNGTGNGTED